MDYKKFQTELAGLVEDEYREFSMKGTPTDWPFLGVRLPYLRQFAKEIIKSDEAEEFLKNKPQSFEELMVHGIVIASLPYEEMLGYFDGFVSKIDNWGVCDTFCNSLKSIKKHREDFAPKINELLGGPEFYARVALVILLSHYVEKENLEFIFGSIGKVAKREEYYVKMAIAWLVAECFIKFPDETWEYLAGDNLPKWTQNKAISKIRDSFRVDHATKDALITLRK